MRARLNPSKRKRGHCEITERDVRILRMLWRWKVLSSMALARKFFPDINPLSAYRRLQYLEDDGYIKAVIFEGRGREIWTLADRGFKFILPKLGELKQQGYKSENIYHDYLATAFQLGEWLTHQPEQTANHTEQQLRRLPVDAWPSWVPASTTHRPDGYSAFMQNEKVMVAAYEVELSPKERSRYEAVVAFYDAQDAIQFVFWLVNDRTTMNSLKKSFVKFSMRAIHKHHFVLLSDFQEKGWMAPFIEGQFAGKCMADILGRRDVVQASLWHRGVDALALLDSRRRPIIPRENDVSGVTLKS